MMKRAWTSLLFAMIAVPAWAPSQGLGRGPAPRVQSGDPATAELGLYAFPRDFTRSPSPARTRIHCGWSG